MIIKTLTVTTKMRTLTVTTNNIDDNKTDSNGNKDTDSDNENDKANNSKDSGHWKIVFIIIPTYECFGAFLFSSLTSKRCKETAQLHADQEDQTSFGKRSAVWRYPLPVFLRKPGDGTVEGQGHGNGNITGWRILDTMWRWCLEDISQALVMGFNLNTL